MSLYWLTYRVGGRLSGVLIMEASDLLFARFRANVEARDGGAEFAEGHELGAEHAALVPHDMIGRLLSLDDASKLIKRLERAIPKRPPAPSVRRGRRARWQATSR